MNRKLLTVAGLTATACLVVAGLVLGPRVADRPFTITAQFEDSIGLYSGNAVSVLGMPIGSVTSITPKGTYVEVTIAIDKGVNIPADAQAVTVSTSILTDRHIELSPAYRSGPKLRSGDVLPLGRTRTPVEFDRTLGMVDTLASALRGDSKGGGPVADLINVGAKISSGNGPEIKDTLDQLSQALRLGPDNGAHSKKDIQTIATSLSALTTQAADNDAAIREFGTNLRQLSDILNSENLGTGTTGSKINQILAQATALLKDNRDPLKATTADMRTLTQALIDYRRELAEFFDVAPLAIDNGRNAIDPDAGAMRIHALADKTLMQSQFAKEICNLIGVKQLGCATGTLRDYGPDFGLTKMFDLMAGAHQ